jgi:polysaccharide deacetylase 2 family uncharacterized protein YibQ
VNNGKVGLGQHFPRFSYYRVFIFSTLVAVLLYSAGCKRKSPPLSTAAIRAITREFVFAAKNASDGRAEVGMHPEYAPRPPAVPGQPGRPSTLVADHIYITVPLAKSGGPNTAVHDAIEKELERVAEYHHLQRVTRPGAPGLERFDYLAQGQRTQSIHLITPLATTVTSYSAPRHPRLAIVIDDLGSDRAQADTLFRLSYPLTISILPHHSNSSEIAEEAHRRGYEVMLHLPMASYAGDKDESIELHPGMDASSVGNAFVAMLDTVPYASGVNNHEGSLGTSNQRLMDELMPLLRQHQLFFIDSRTTAATVAETTAHAAGVPAASRNVFLDDDQSAAAIRKQFALAIRDAREKGSALAIGHPHPETLQVLAEMLPEAGREGVTLVFASDLVR